VRSRDVADPPRSNDPDFLSTWSNASKLDELPSHIDRIVAGWQGGAKAKADDAEGEDLS
jgi:hypothetical protein